MIVKIACSRPWRCADSRAIRASVIALMVMYKESLEREVSMNLGYEGLVVQNGVSEQKGIGGSQEALGVPEDITLNTRVKNSKEYVGELTTNTNTNTVIVFDFDWSLINCNSDTWVVEKLGGGDAMKSLLQTLPWTQLMDTMMTQLHASGCSLDDINQCLQLAPIEHEMIATIQMAAKLGCELQIVSDANSHFIDVILDTHGLRHYFTKVHTNPAHLAENGALRVLPFHQDDNLPHGCPLCPPNMCKGSILDSLLEAKGTERRRVIYVGDGGGDFCPALRLLDGDHVLARTRFPLLKKLKESSAVKATVHVWMSARDVEAIIKLLL